MNEPSHETTSLLRSFALGDRGAEARLLEVVYAELKRIATAAVRGDVRDATLRPTALVNEAWLKLVAVPERTFESKRHFLGVAAKAMRSVLVDHQRARRAQKRGVEHERVPLDETIEALETDATDLLDLEDALRELEGDDPELVELVELRFFAGLTHEQIAELKGASLSTIERTWRVARARLHQRLGGEP